MKKFISLLSILFLFAIAPEAVNADPEVLIDEVSIEKTDLFSSDVVTNVIVQASPLLIVETAINEERSQKVVSVYAQNKQFSGISGDLWSESEQILDIKTLNEICYYKTDGVKPKRTLLKTKRFKPPRFGV
jgi:hypothetical protein